MKSPFGWPKGPVYWRSEDRRLSYCSIPFTFALKDVKKRIEHLSGNWLVGGPACALMPDYFADMPNVSVGRSLPGVLQKLHPYATRTTLGCPNRCRWCAIGTRAVEPNFEELADWPDLPVLCDNNLLAASEHHLGIVFNRLRWWGWADFNQGLDCRLITPTIAAELASIGTATVRVSLDGWSVLPAWEEAIARLREAGIPTSRIQSYVMIGYGDTPDRDIERVAHAKTVLAPSAVNAMWFHELHAMKANTVTPKQKEAGWSDRLRIDTMRWSYGRAAKPSYSHPSPTERGGPK